MKRIIIAAGVVMSVWAGAQQSDNPYIYDEPDNIEAKADGDFPTAPTDPPAPIDDYIPALLIAAVGLVIAYGKRSKLNSVK